MSEEDFILEQISKSVYTLSPNRKGRSVMWGILSEIIKEDESILEGYVYCRTCLKLLKHTAAQTSNLTRHKCCVTLKKSNGLKIVTREDKKSFKDISVAWITEDCQPYTSVSGSGFAKIVKFFVKIGAKYGENIDILDLLPDAKTLSRAMQKITTDKKNEINDEIAQSGGASTTIGLWTDNRVRRNFWGEDKKSVIDISVAWITEDCKPYSAISGSGFAKIVKFIVKIGAKYGGNIDISELIPDATTLSRATQKLAANKKNEIKNEIAKIVQSGGASATIDLWTDNYARRNFLGVTLHYQKKMKLYDIILGMKSMDFERSTGANISCKLDALFGEFGIKNTGEIKFVTDRESKVVKALKNNIRLNCSSHLFANVLEHSLNETLEIKELVKSCKKIVKYFKKANLQHQLPTSLKSDCTTSWNSNFTMFKSIVDNWLQINQILIEEKETQRLSLIGISTLRDLVDLCSGFEIIFKRLQLCSSPSLYFVIPSIQKVEKLCLPKETDDVAILSLKENIKKNLDKIWAKNLSLWQKTAFFLYPPALSVSQTDITDIKNFCISQINKINSSTSHDCMPNSPSTTYSDSDSLLSASETSLTIDPNKESSNQSQFQFFFEDILKKQTLNRTKAPSEEIERYCTENVEYTDDFDVLHWWNNNKKFYPYLSKFAMQVHSIPASSAASERAFSLAGDVITERRNRLAPTSVDSLLFLHSYFKKLKN